MRLLIKQKNRQEKLNEKDHLKLLLKVLSSKHVTIYNWLDFRKEKIKLRHIKDIANDIKVGVIRRQEDIKEDMEAQIRFEESIRGIRPLDIKPNKEKEANVNLKKKMTRRKTLFPSKESAIKIRAENEAN